MHLALGFAKIGVSPSVEVGIARNFAVHQRHVNSTRYGYGLCIEIGAADDHQWRIRRCDSERRRQRADDVASRKPQVLRLA
jgi:hypothetical protein